MYLLYGLINGIIAVSYSLVIRLELSLSNQQFLSSIYNNNIYYVYITNHGLQMIFLMTVPILIGCFGNVLLPIMVGSIDMIFSRLNNLSFILLIPSMLLIVYSSFLYNGAPVGWTLYYPLSSIFVNSTISLDLMIFAIHLIGVSSLVGSINFIITVVNNKIFILYKSLNIFVWCICISSLLLILSLPILAVCVTLVLFDRNFSTSFYSNQTGGNVLLYQHLFWLFGHPEVYILIIPAFGLISELIIYITNRNIFGYIGMIYALLSISILGLLVWSHHMFVVGMNYYSKKYFTISTTIIGIPTGLKVFSWIFSMFSSNLYYNYYLYYYVLYIYSFILVFTIGGFTGIMVSNSILDISLHDTYFIVAHFHYVLSVSIITTVIIALIHYTSLLTLFISIENTWIYIVQFILFFIGINSIFLPMHLIGINGLSRRYFDFNEAYSNINYFISFGLFITIFSMFIFIYLILIILYKKSCVNFNYFYNKSYFYNTLTSKVNDIYCVCSLDRVNNTIYHNFIEKPIV